MKRTYKLSQLLIIGVLILNLFLQSCNNFSILTIPSKEEEIVTNSLAGNQAPLDELPSTQLVAHGGHVANLYQAEGILQAIVEENITIGFSRIHHDLSVYRAADMNVEKLASWDKGVQKRIIGVNLSANGEPGYVYVDNRGLKGGVKRKAREEKNTKEKKGEIIKQANVKRIRRRQHLLPEEKFSRDEEITSALALSPMLPVELLQMILGYVKYPYILDCRKVNHVFYELISGYPQIGLVGVANKPSSVFSSFRWIKNKAINFREPKFSELSPEIISSFFFYRLMGRVCNLPPSFWPYISGTQIQALYLNYNELRDGDALVKALLSTQVHKPNLSDDQSKAGEANGLAKALLGTQLHTFNLAYNYLGDEVVSQLAKALPGTQIRTLNLAYNYLGDEEISNLARVLHKTQIHTLNLSSNLLRAAGVSQLAQALLNTHIHTLYLGDNQLGPEGASELAKILSNTSVHTLNLDKNRLGSAGISELAKALSSTHVHTLYLEDNQLGPEGISELAKILSNAHVHTLYLGNNQLGPAGISELAKALSSTHVHTLYLGDNQLGPEGVSELTKVLFNTSVHTLNLIKNHLGPAGVSELAKTLSSTHIHTLYLGDNQLGPKGASELAKFLPGTRIRILYLNNNQLGDKGVMELAKTLSDTKIHVLNLGHNQISVKIQQLLKKGYPHIKKWIF